MKLMLDTIEYQSKPVGFEAGSVSNRIIKNPADSSIEDLAESVGKGRTFTPAYFKGKEGKIKRNKDYWYSQEIIAMDFDDGMTLDEAKKEFSETAAFIYTTFSHTEVKHKFRVVFVLDRILYKVEEFNMIMGGLILKYAQADKHCKDCTRLFYGGKKVILLNYTNRLVVNDYVKNNPNDSGGTKKNLVLYPAKNTKQTQTRDNEEGKETVDNIIDNIELIQRRSIKELRAKLRTKPKVVYNDFELMDYLKQQDLRMYLGIEHKQNFIDIFHDESNPSASIYQSNKGNGHQLYKCFSTSHPFVGTIIEVTQSLLECSKLEVKIFLMEVYQIVIKESEQQKELKASIDVYIELLQSDDLKNLYPNFYKVFNQNGHFQDLYILLETVKEYLPSGEDPRLLFYQSIDTISKKFKRSGSATHIRINFLTFFKLISKLNFDQIPKELLEYQSKSKREKGHKYTNSTYEINIYDLLFFKELDDMCLLWIEKGCTTKTVNYEGILRNFGRAEADRVFPQDNGKVIKPLNEAVVSKIHTTTLEFIESYGWTSETEVLDNVSLYFKGQQSFKQKQFKICIGEMMEAYDLERVRLNKELKEKLKIDSKGYGYIIKRKEYKEEMMIDSPVICENDGIFD